jgi:hypothetical protein
MKRTPVLHPFIFGLFPVINLLAGNVSEAHLLDAAPVAAITLGVVSAVLGITYIFVKDMLRAAMITSGFVIFFFSPFHVYLALHGWLDDIYAPAARFSMYAVFAAFILGMICWIYFFTKKAAGLGQLNRILNLVAVCLVAIPVWNITLTKVSEGTDWPRIYRQQQAEPLIAHLTTTPRLPDIYFIIMDRYAGAQTLNTVYGFDNQDFLNYLKAKGFYVAAKSAANYPSTSQSMASSLNLQYINHVKEYVAPESASWIPLYRLLQDNKVRKFLKDKGYQYIHLGSWWEPTRKNRLADKNFQFTPLPEMFYILYGTTMFKPVSDALRLLDLRYEHWRGNQRQFQDLIRTIDTQGPKFVLAHFLLPHNPYVFGRDGGFLPVDRVNQQPEEVSYIDQLIFTNRMLKKTIDALLARTENPPVIILQADEGPWPRRYVHQYKAFDWGQATEAELNQKMKILNSFYLPGADTGTIYPNISPVNTFRLVFNIYFKTNLPLLADESFIYRSYRHPYDLSNITSRLAPD